MLCLNVLKKINRGRNTTVNKQKFGCI